MEKFLEKIFGGYKTIDEIRYNKSDHYRLCAVFSTV